MVEPFPSTRTVQRRMKVVGMARPQGCESLCRTYGDGVNNSVVVRTITNNSSGWIWVGPRLASPHLARRYACNRGFQSSGTVGDIAILRRFDSTAL